MRVLEARFHPHKRGHAPEILVGRVLCDGASAWVEAVQPGDGGTVPSGSSGAMVEKLRYLVKIAGARPFDRLHRLQSDYWSFVENDRKGDEP